MKKYYWLLFFLFPFAFLACDDSDEVEPDASDPVVTITAPTANATVLVIEAVTVEANISDNMGLKEIRLFTVDPDGTRNRIENPSFEIHNTTRNKNVSAVINLSSQSSTGAYTVLMEAEDKEQNVATSSVIINVDAPNLDFTGFNTVLGDRFMVGEWDYGGVTPFNEEEFSYKMYTLLDYADQNGIASEAEFNRFALDFGLQNQTWAKWNANGDMALSFNEFKAGLSQISFFDNWDLDNDNTIAKDEVTAGIFNTWDDDKNDLLNRNEYVERFYTYFIF